MWLPSWGSHEVGQSLYPLRTSGGPAILVSGYILSTSSLDDIGFISNLEGTCKAEISVTHWIWRKLWSRGCMEHTPLLVVGMGAPRGLPGSSAACFPRKLHLLWLYFRAA